MHLSLPKQFPLLSLFWLPLFASLFSVLISALTRGKGGHLFRLNCSVVLWGGRNTAKKHHWCVGGVLTVSGPHWVCRHSWHVCFARLHCSGSRLLCRGTVLKQALSCMHFPGLSCSGSGSGVLHKGTDSAGPTFCVLPSSEQLRQSGA